MNIKRTIAASIAALALIANVSIAFASNPNGQPPGNDGDLCHGANQTECRDDPNPNGQDCEVHGNGGGSGNDDSFNDDHCGQEVAPSTSPSDSPTPSASVTPSAEPSSEPSIEPSATPPAPSVTPSPVTSETPSEPSVAPSQPTTTLPPTDIAAVEAHDIDEGAGTGWLSGINVVGFLAFIYLLSEFIGNRRRGTK